MSLVSAEDLGRRFVSGGFLTRYRHLQAVTDVTFALARGEAVGLIGESGSGKSTLGRLVLGLLRPTSGRVLFDGVDIGKMRAGRSRNLRRRMQLVFQDPYASLDPRRRAGNQIADGLAIHRLVARAEREHRVQELLEEVGLLAGHARRYPHEFSGGQRQRVAIARALSTAPDFLVADEPTSALDVSVQAQVLGLLTGLRSRRGLTILFISHDLAAVRHLCSRVIILYLGRVMEEGDIETVFTAPRHPYTLALLSAQPSLDPLRRRQRILLAGEPPDPVDPPSGCVFRTRCSYALPACATAVPPLREAAEVGHRFACIREDVSSVTDARHPPGWHGYVAPKVRCLERGR